MGGAEEQKACVHLSINPVLGLSALLGGAELLLPGLRSTSGLECGDPDMHTACCIPRCPPRVGYL